MNDFKSILKGRIYIKILIAVLIGFEIAFLIKVASIEYGDIVGATVKTILFIALILLTYQYSKKWLVILNSLVFIGYGSIMLIGWFMEHDYFLLINSFVYIYMGIIIVISKEIKAYLVAKREKLSIIITDSSNIQEVDIAFSVPSLKTRIISTFIDNLILLGLILVYLKLIPETMPTIARIIIVVLIISYEPVFVWKYKTLGQLIMNIRVRRYIAGKDSISLFISYVRYIVKILLGIVSFISMSITNDKRAIHDLISDTIMIHTNET